MMTRTLTVFGLILMLSACQSETTTSATGPVQTPQQPAEYFETEWTEADSQPILDKTMRLRLDYDDSQLTQNEKQAVKELLAAGHRLHSLFLDQVHPQARDIESKISDPAVRQDLKDLFRLMKGPVTTTLDNRREVFLNAETNRAGGNVYPSGITRDQVEKFFEYSPERRAEFLDLRAVVRAATPENKHKALKALDDYPSLDRLHPGLRERIEQSETFFGLPYSVHYPEDIFYVYERLQKAADYMESEDIAFARFLRLRARDMLADNYDGSDAMWITGDYTGSLNAQIGSYETYDDTLLGVKSFFSLSLLLRDKEKSEELSNSLGDIQAIEDALPYDAKKQVSNRIPVGVYNVIADFGQARGTNTATILPNEGHLSRQFGRTILIRSNILRNERLYETALSSFTAGTDPAHHSDLDIEGNFYRTLWHEIGHYLGPDQTKDGGDIDAALQETADLFEEMKADLVSLFAAPRLHETGAYTDEQLRSIYASGILRVMRKNQPRRGQAYATMQLMQFNWFMDKGLLRYDNGTLKVDYDKYPEAVHSLLKEVLAIQHEGNRTKANAFVEEWTDWDDDLHAILADNMKQAEKYRFRLVTYEALGE